MLSRANGKQGKRSEDSASVLPGARQLALRLLALTGVLGLLFVAVTSLPGLDEVRHELAGATHGWLAVSLLLEGVSCLAFVIAFRAVLCPRLPWGPSYDIGMAAQGTNVLLPAGGTSGLALGAWALLRTGMSSESLAPRTVALFLVTSAVNFATAVLAGGALALGLLDGEASLVLTAGPALLAAAAIAGVLALPRALDRPDRTQVREGRIARMAALARTALSDGVREARSLVRARNLGVIGGAIGYMACDLAALAAAFEAVGSMPPLGVLLLAYVVGQLGGLIPLPGGVGGADGGLIAALALYGTPLAAAAAAVLAYRAFQLGLPALLGAVAMIRLPGVLSSVEDANRLSGPSPAHRLPRSHMPGRQAGIPSAAGAPA